jgi:antitoxin component YwqK of YwqJK toxin-antitoxin module
MHKPITIPFLLIVLFDLANAARGQSIYLDNIDNKTSAVKKAGVSKEFIYVFEIKKDKLRDSGIAAVINYDTSGCIVSSERYDLPNDPKAKTIYYYNDQLKLIKMAITYSRQTPTTVEIAYDSVGRELFRSEYSRFRRFIEWKEYNEIGKLHLVYNKINNNKRYLHRKYYYSPNGRLQRLESFDEYGRWSYTERIEFGRDSLELNLFLENPVLKKLNHTSWFNRENQLVKRRYYLDNAEQYNDHYYRYNADGTIAEWAVYSNGKLFSLKRHHYYYFD